MSDENETPTADEAPTGAVETQDNVKFPKKQAAHVTREQVDVALAERGLVEHPMTAFSRVGPKDGPHLTVSRAKKIARVYGHGIVVEHPAVTSFTPEERKEKGLGGITCQLDVEHVDHLAGLGAMLDAVGHGACSIDASPPSSEE
jgi:hypothetical protein